MRIRELIRILKGAYKTYKPLPLFMLLAIPIVGIISLIVLMVEREDILEIMLLLLG